MGIIDTLIGLRGGGAAIEMENGLADVIKAVRATGKKGKITLTLDVLPADKATPVETVFVRDRVKVEEPKAEKKLSLFFTTEEGQLTTNDTRQMDLLSDNTSEVRHQ